MKLYSVHIQSAAAVGICCAITLAAADETSPKQTPPNVAARATDVPAAAKETFVKSVAQAMSLPHTVTSVRVEYTMAVGDDFGPIMRVLAEREHIRNFNIRLPNSTHVKDESLKVLGKLRHARSLSLEDDRDWKSPEVFGYVATLKQLEVFKCEFG